MFDIKRSTKSYIECTEHFIVAYKGTVYLRIVGEEGNYKVMTATAGEDDHKIIFFNNQMALNEAALNVSVILNVMPRVKIDYHNREYVEICQCEYISDAYRAAEMLFEKLGDHKENRTSEALQSLYSELTIDDSGSDVYLSDGMWLSSDGKLKDIGR